MVRGRFNQAFERLREQSNRLANVERTPDNFDQIVAERVELDRLRKETTAARKDVVSRFEPPTPDVVEPPRGSSDVGLLGKVGAAVACLLIVGIVIAGFNLVRTVGRGYPLELVDVVESIDQECAWRVQATIRNDGDRQIEIDSVKTVLDREYVGAERFAPFPLDAGQQATLDLVWQKGWLGGCLDNAEQIDHGNLIFTLTDDEISRSF